MLQQGPAKENDIKPCQTREVTMLSAPTYSHGRLLVKLDHFPSRGKKYKNLWNHQIVNFLCNYIRQQSLISRLAPEKWWLEDDPFLLKRKLFMAYLKLREGRLYSFQWQKTTKVSHDWDTWRSSGQRVHREVSRSQEESLEFNTLTKRKIINQINRMFKGCILIGLTMMH